jgi:hypothetical protein
MPISIDIKGFEVKGFEVVGSRWRRWWAPLLVAVEAGVLGRGAVAGRMSDVVSWSPACGVVIRWLPFQQEVTNPQTDDHASSWNGAGAALDGRVYRSRSTGRRFWSFLHPIDVFETKIGVTRPGK